MKEAFARVTVELAKHMWPQRWGSFINDMDTLAKCGVCLTMHVVRILGRKFTLCGYDVESVC